MGNDPSAFGYRELHAARALHSGDDVRFHDRGLVIVCKPGVRRFRVERTTVVLDTTATFAAPAGPP